MTGRRGKRRVRLPVADTGVEFSGQINSWLIKVCFQALRRGQASLDPEVLEDYCWSRLVKTDFMVSHYEVQRLRVSGNRITDVQAQQIITSVVRFVLQEYSAAEFSKIQSKRARAKTRFTLADLRHYLHLSKTETARMLGCSTATVSRLRAQLRKTALGNLIWLMARARARREEKRHGPSPAAHSAADDILATPYTWVARHPARPGPQQSGEGGLHPAGRHGAGTSGSDPAGGDRPPAGSDPQDGRLGVEIAA